MRPLSQYFVMHDNTAINEVHGCLSHRLAMEIVAVLLWSLINKTFKKYT